MKKKSSYVTFRCPASSSPGQWATSTIPFSSKSKGFSIEDFQSYFNTVLSTIWNHQFTSSGNSEALSCLVWLWSNWEFNKESFALKRLGVSLIFSCLNFYWGGVDCFERLQWRFIEESTCIVGLGSAIYWHIIGIDMRLLEIIGDLNALSILLSLSKIPGKWKHYW